MTHCHHEESFSTFRARMRTDYILMNQALLPYVTAASQLDMHGGNILDHVALLMNIDEQQLFQGWLHCLVEQQSQEFILAQEDKCALFMANGDKIFTHQNFMCQIGKVACNIATHGPTSSLIGKYQCLDREFKESIPSSVLQASQRKFGYQQSLALGEEGHNLLLWKSIYFTKCNATKLARGHYISRLEC